MQKYILLLLFFPFITYGCLTNTSKKENQASKNNERSKSLAGKLPDYKHYNLAQLLFEKENNEVIAAAKDVIIYKEKTSQNIRIGIQEQNDLQTWKLLDVNESDKFTCHFEKVDFDNQGQTELLLQYKVREVYSSMGSSYSGMTTLWNLDSFEKYFEVTHYEAEAPGRNGDGEFTECEYDIQVQPFKIIIKALHQEGNCPKDKAHEEYCLVGDAVEKCK